MEISNIELAEFRVELENQMSKMEQDCETLKKQFAQLNINVDLFPESIRTELEAVADFQLSHRIDEMDDISVPLGFTESVLKGVKESILNKKKKRETYRLHQLQNQLDNCLKTLIRDERSYENEKKHMEAENRRLQTETVLSQPQQRKSNESLEDTAVDENAFNLKMKKIKELNLRCNELMVQIEDENKYLKQFAGVPPSISEAAKCVESQKERVAAIDLNIESIASS